MLENSYNEYDLINPILGFEVKETSLGLENILDCYDIFKPYSRDNK